MPFAYLAVIHGLSMRQIQSKSMASTINDIKKQLQGKDKKDLINLIVRLGKFRKENKELLSYLLYDAGTPDQFVSDVRSEIDELFSEINYSSVYFIKKSVRKIVRILHKYIRFVSDKPVEASLLAYFCHSLKMHPVPLKKSVQLQNIYDSQWKKLQAALEALHPDLQHDLLKEMDLL